MCKTKCLFKIKESQIILLRAKDTWALTEAFLQRSKSDELNVIPRTYTHTMFFLNGQKHVNRVFIYQKNNSRIYLGVSRVRET